MPCYRSAWGLSILPRACPADRPKEPVAPEKKRHEPFQLSEGFFLLRLLSSRYTKNVEMSSIPFPTAPRQLERTQGAGLSSLHVRDLCLED